MKTVLLTLCIFAASPSAAWARGEAFADLTLELRPGARLPLATELIDETGNPVTLGRFFDGKPVVLVFDYLPCRPTSGVSPAAPHLTPAGLAPALDPANSGRTGGGFGRLLLLCFGQGAGSGRYPAAIEAALVCLNFAGMLAACGLFAWVRRRHHD